MKQQLSKNDIWQLGEKLKKCLGRPDLITPRDRVELVDCTIYLVNNQPQYFKQGDRVVPVLRFLLETPTLLRKIVVDMGAIPYITKGSDVFRPGIKESDSDIKKGDFVVVVDERHGKPLCVGEALMSGADIKALDKGCCIKNLHYVGDRIWNL